MDNKNNHLIQQISLTTSKFVYLFIILLLAACSSGGEDGQPTPLKPESIQMPNIIGVNETTAVEILSELDLESTVTRVNYNAMIGEVVDQDPGTGEDVEVGTAVSITVSEGISVPDVIGMTESEASQTLADAALNLSVTQENNIAEIGAVVSQSMSASTNVNPGTIIELVLSNGIPIPDVIGMTNSEARTALTNLGFVIVENRVNNTAIIDTVINQDYTSGTNINFGSTVTLTVSNGITVPNLIGMDIQNARTILTNLGFGIVENRQNHSAPINSVLSQTPAASTNVNAGSTVSVTVSDGILIPSVIGMSEEEARTALSDVGFNVSASHTENSAPINQVFNQDPLPNVNLNAGSLISISVSLGMLVPDTVGMILADGTALLNDKQLVINIVRVDDIAPVDTIIAQSIVPGVYVNSGTAIEITVSNGLIVPNVVGMDVTAATTLLENAGFNVVVNEVVNSTQVSGEVFEQNPAGASQANGVDTVTLSVYTSPQAACLQDPTTLSLVGVISLADAAKGGRIYDKWWVATSTQTNPTPAPIADHPIWSQQTTNLRTGADTWRCKECHGWDYKGVDGIYGDTTNSHYTGFAGVFDARSKDPLEVYCAIYSGTTNQPTHDFSAVLTNVDILHITKFITASQNESPNEPAATGIIDVGLHFDTQGTPISANLNDGEVLYSDNNISCAASNCHGIDGTAQHVAIGELADSNPWQTLHKIRFGHPGSNMPAFTSPPRLTTQQSVDIIAYAQNSLPNADSAGTCLTDYATFVSDNALLADPIRGGRLYDKWWVEAGTAAPATEHPLWVTRDQPTVNTSSGSTTWRCQECHGWDYKGADGVYGDTGNSHYTGFPGVLAAQNRSPLDVFCAIRSGTGITAGMHNFSSVMSDENILHVAVFLTSPNSGQVETNNYINFATGESLGDSVAGEALYLDTTGCSASNCHGVDGTAQPEPIGFLADGDPWKVFHKIRYGHPGALMPAYSSPSSSTTFTLNEISDVIRYAQVNLGTGGGTQPPPIVSDLQIISRGGRLYDNWMSESGASVPLVDNPTWALQTYTGGTNTRTGESTWRCNECHGWDYKGREGVYGDNTNTHYTGFGGVFNTLKTEAEIVEYLTNGAIIFGQPVHSFDGLISPEDMQALAKFIKLGLMDTSLYIGSDGVINGTPENIDNGLALYSWNGNFGTPNGNCELCHSTDGKGEPAVILGLIATIDPWSYVHKVRFGQPGATMPALIDQIDPGTGTAAFDTQDAVDITQYSQSLPTQ